MPYSVRTVNSVGPDPSGNVAVAGSAYTLPAATSAVLGGVKIGANVTTAADGTFSVSAPYTDAQARASADIYAGTAPVNVSGTTVSLSAGAGLSVTSGALTANVVSVAGRTGSVTISRGDVSGAGALAGLGVGAGLTSSGGLLSANLQSFAGLTGAPTVGQAQAPLGLGSAAYQPASALYSAANPAGYQTAAEAAADAPVQSVAGRTGNVALSVSDISGAAPLASPALTNTPTALTAPDGTQVR